MIKKLILPVLALLAITSCSSDELLQESPNPSGQPYISFNTLISNNTRAEADEEDAEDADEFEPSYETTAKKIREDENGFKIHAYTTRNASFFDLKTAKYEEEKNSFWIQGETQYYWPESNVTFAAWYPASVNFSIGENSPAQHDYKITNQDLGVGKTDIVFASTTAKHASNYAQPQPLNFYHLFAQAIVQAQNSAKTYTVQIKEVELRNVAGSGNYSQQSFPDLNNDFTQMQVNLAITPDIATLEELKKGEKIYTFSSGVPEAQQTITTDQNSFSVLVGNKDSQGGLHDGFFMIRQAFDGRNTESDNNHTNSALSWTGTSENNGAYLAIKAKLVSNDGKNTVLYPQPQATEDESEDEDGYGWIAIPVFKNLSIKAGYRYIFNLKFTDDGAGQIPPGEDNGGDPVLGKPIHFSVEEIGWQDMTENATWTGYNNNGTPTTTETSSEN